MDAILNMIYSVDTTVWVVFGVILAVMLVISIIKKAIKLAVVLGIAAFLVTVVFPYIQSLGLEQYLP